MDRLYHLVQQPVELKAGQYLKPASLQTEGFVHLCHQGQIAWVANAFLADAGVLWVMELDPAQLGSEIRMEPAGRDGVFPHLYGPIPHKAVARQMPLCRDGASRWCAPPQLDAPLAVAFRPLP
jgi:uncharacterized protein (DUF952 family)